VTPTLETFPPQSSPNLMGRQMVAFFLLKRRTTFEGVMIEPYHQPYRLNSASVTANARNLPVALWFLATADCEGRTFFLLSCVGHLESVGVTQLCWHRNSRPSCTRTVVAGRANAATIKTNQANALRT